MKERAYCNPRYSRGLASKVTFAGMVVSQPSAGIDRYSAWAPKENPLNPNNRSPALKDVTRLADRLDQSANSPADDSRPRPYETGQESHEDAWPLESRSPSDSPSSREP